MGLQEIKRTPMLVVNFKCYLEASGERGLTIAKHAQAVAEATGVNVIVAPQFVDIQRISSSVAIPVFAQHLDPITPGPHTGRVLPEALKLAGAKGAIINHSERQLILSEIEAGIVRSRETGLASIVCANTSPIAAAVSALNPDIVAIEPPELIGTGIAVSKARPEVITQTINLLKKVNEEVIVLCGAGITVKEDAAAAIRLGSEGVLISSSVVKAQNPRQVLHDLASAMIG